MDRLTGFRFCPDDEELLSYYLPRRLKGEPTQFQIPDVDVYSIEPWSLFDDIDINDSYDDGDDDDKEEEATCSKNLIYVFTNIKKKHGKGSKRIGRTVTTSLSSNQVIGTWKGQTKEKYIIDTESKKSIGVMKMFSFMPAPSKQDHDDVEGTSKNRKRKQNTIDQLDGISYIMHEYSMAGSSYVLCRIRRKISAERKMNNKKVKYFSSCSRNISRKNTGWDDQGTEYDEPLQGTMRSTYDDHQMRTDSSLLLNHNHGSMWQQQQTDQDAEYDPQIQESMSQRMMNTSVFDHGQSSILEQQKQDEDAEYDQQIQECMSQQQQPDQDAEYEQQGRMPPYDDDNHQIMVNTSVLDYNQCSMWQQQQPDQDAQDDQQLQGRMPYVEMMNAPIALDENESPMRQKQQPVPSEEGDTGDSPILTEDEDAFAHMLANDILLNNEEVEEEEEEEEEVALDENESPMRQKQQPVQSEEGDTGDSPILTEDEDAFAHMFANDIFLDNEEVDLSNQQQQPPAPTSEQEDYPDLSSIDFQTEDYPDFGNLCFPPSERFDDPLDNIPLWGY